MTGIQHADITPHMTLLNLLKEALQALPAADRRVAPLIVEARRTALSLCALPEDYIGVPACAWDQQVQYELRLHLLELNLQPELQFYYDRKNAPGRCLLPPVRDVAKAALEAEFKAGRDVGFVVISHDGKSRVPKAYGAEDWECFWAMVDEGMQGFWVGPATIGIPGMTKQERQP